MPVFDGIFRPPSVAPTVSPVAIGGAGRCEITDETMVFDGFKSSVSLKTIALGLAAGAGFAALYLLLDTIGVISFSWTYLVGAFGAGLVSVSLFRRQQGNPAKPVRYEVKLTGVKRVAPYIGTPSTLLIEAPEIRPKAGIFFQPAQGVETFLRAYNEARATAQAGSAA